MTRFGGPLGPESSHFLPWFWHVLFDGTRVCRCWHSIWARDLREHERARRQNECGNCDWCLMPVDVLIMRGEITPCGTDQASSTTLRSRFSRPWTRRSATKSSAQV